jgi:RES domain-containing protein
LRLYRIADCRYGPENGEGARRFGGRWNSPGRAVIYACTSYAGAMLEKLVHTGRKIPKPQVCVTFEFPDDLPVEALSAADMPGCDSPAAEISRRLGDDWLRDGRSAVLLVPSVVFDVERNALINPAHADYRAIRVVEVAAVRWDDRLFPRNS